MSTENTKEKVELEVIDEKKEKREIILINEETIHVIRQIKCGLILQIKTDFLRDTEVA